ncbi:MAG: hydrogenase 4 subunit B [Gammaproteobacteria bacterium]|nr:hydrogenase 4 subunit B [Gammaproteobacteria bacterium]
MMTGYPTELIAVTALGCGWLLIGLLALARPHSVSWVARGLFPLGALAGIVLTGLALAALHHSAQTLVLPLGLPQLPLHLRLDALSAVFLLLIGATSAGISMFAAGYFRTGEGTAPGLLALQYHLFLASMLFVVLADDAFSFMIAWESMALSSYFLVTSQHRIAEIRRAGFLYLLMAHLGAVGILLCFGVLQGGSWQFSFAALRAAHLTPLWASIAFFLALLGFGTKAGLVPLHVWLPEAHPAAPSPVSALMSGVMLEIAVYGLLRVSLDLLHAQVWWWGLAALGLGLLTALYGVMFAAVQTDMKRLLAYSSIENIGIIFLGFGLTVVFQAFRMPVLAALALAATLYHCLNHAFAKSLLFLGTGSVLHATGERNFGRLGGLIHRMPWVAWLVLAGTLAIAGLPPLNGFVSEWLLLQSFLFTPTIPHDFINMLLPLGAAGLVLAAALSGYVMVKFYGIVFLGQPREARLAQARDCGRLERLGLLWLAAGCVFLGLIPVQMLALFSRVTEELLGASLGTLSQHWWLLAPLSAQRASYSPVAFMFSIVAFVALTLLTVRLLYHGRVRRAAPWGCGGSSLTPRMQDTSEGFGQPIRQIFEPFFRLQRELPTPLERAPHYRVQVEDRFWFWLYAPAAALVQRIARLASVVQQGRISVYLLYSFLTLMALLVLVL